MKINNKFKEWLSVQSVKRPGAVIICAILLLNLVFFFLIAPLIISALAPSSVPYTGFWASVFYTITMVLDAGCIQFVIEDVGEAGVAVIIACLVIIIIGMVTFTGAVIGYLTNYISNFIGQANSGSRKLNVSGHTVILNWNTRASEIVNDMLYSESAEKVVVLVNSGKAAVEQEITDRLMGTLEKENRDLQNECAKMGVVRGWFHYRKNRMKNRVTVIVREGDTFSTKKLNDISIKKAKDVVILSRDIQNTLCKLDYQELKERNENGNTNTVKTLIQVADLTGAADSADDQQIIVEVDDAWTLSLINRIIEHKERKGKCNIVPLTVDKILGQILSQFAIMPELNMAYSELFSNRGAAFYCTAVPGLLNEHECRVKYMERHTNAIPLTCMAGKEGPQVYYMADSQKHLNQNAASVNMNGYTVKVNQNYWMERRNIVILGHNSKCRAIMNGFDAFRSEWNFKDPALIEQLGTAEILNIMVIDDAKSLKKLDYYKEYPYVNEVIEADIYDKQRICDEISRFADAHEGDTSVLILSDDDALSDEIDANALTYLIYIQDIISDRLKADPDFDVESIDVIVEILNPKNYDIVRSYSVNNIVISNRYISKMVAQIGEKGSIYNFYNDILTYDEEGCDDYESNELYVKKVTRFFDEIPGSCTAAQFIRAVYEASPEGNKSIALGYVKPGGKMVLFSGDQNEIWVELNKEDKVILFSNH